MNVQLNIPHHLVIEAVGLQVRAETMPDDDSVCVFVSIDYADGSMLSRVMDEDGGSWILLDRWQGQQWAAHRAFRAYQDWRNVVAQGAANLGAATRPPLGS